VGRENFSAEQRGWSRPFKLRWGKKVGKSGLRISIKKCFAEQGVSDMKKIYLTSYRYEKEHPNPPTEKDIDLTEAGKPIGGRKPIDEREGIGTVRRG